jgi:hypothetical protein
MKKKKLTSWILLGLLGILIGIQFIRPVKNKPVSGTKDIATVIPVSPEVQQILSVSCYDCHSNTTHYPWYAEIMPVGWWLGHHVDEGKRELNFSDAGSYTLKKLDHKLEEVEEEIREGHMPPDNYLILHKDAKLSEEQKKLLYDWVREGRKMLRETE